MLPTITHHGYSLDAEVAYRREQLIVSASRHRLRRAFARLRRRSAQRLPAGHIPAPRSAPPGTAEVTARASTTGSGHSLAA